MLPELYDMFFDERDAMLCDIEETKDGYEMNMAMPGVDKKDIRISLKDGYLTVAVKAQETDDHLIRQERYHGGMSRRFYVGDGLKSDGIKAQLVNGELHVTVPKLSEKALEENSRIGIE